MIIVTISKQTMPILIARWMRGSSARSLRSWSPTQEPLLDRRMFSLTCISKLRAHQYFLYWPCQWFRIVPLFLFRYQRCFFLSGKLIFTCNK